MAGKAGGALPGLRFQPGIVYVDDQSIFRQGDHVDHLYQVEQGCVRVYRLHSDGRRQITGFHLPGECFGFDGRGTRSTFADAVGETRVCALRLSSDSRLSADLLPLALAHLARTQELLMLIGRQNALERVAVFLLDMLDRQQSLGQIDLPMPRADIADYLGLTIETVSRIFSRLKSEAIISVSGQRSVRVLNYRHLCTLAETGSVGAGEIAAA